MFRLPPLSQAGGTYTVTMSARPDEYRDALDSAHAHAMGWLQSVPTRQVGPRLSADELFAEFSMPLQEQPIDALAVVDELARLAEPGLMAMPAGRFFGWVIGGTPPRRWPRTGS